MQIFFINLFYIRLFYYYSPHSLSQQLLAARQRLYLVLCVVWGLVVITGGSLSVLNDTVMSGSLYYKVFNLFNPFL